MIRRVTLFAALLSVTLVAFPASAQFDPPAAEVTVATLPGAPSSGDTVWVTDATGPTADPASWDCEVQGDPQTKLLCSWDGANWIGIRRQEGGSSGTAPPQMIGTADRVGYTATTPGDWTEGVPTEVETGLDTLAGRVGGGGSLPAGGTIGDLIENDSPGSGVWVGKGTLNVGTATALAVNPTQCDAEEFVTDTDADGTLNCADPLTGRTLDDMPGVNTLLGSTGNIRYSVSEDGVTDNAICFDVNDNLKDCGVAPTGGGNIEAMATAGSGGTAAVSDGDTTVSMQDIATQAELDVAMLYPEAFQGEHVLLTDLGYASPAFDTSAGNWHHQNDWTMEVDLTGNWRIRSQGDVSSDDWQVDSLVCWYPTNTDFVWVQEYCSGDGTHSLADSEGRPCTDAGDCEGSETCDSPDWDISATPDEITITGHDYGLPGTIHPSSFGIERTTGPPVHGVINTSVQCAPGNMSVNDHYWLYVLDADTVIPYEDDGNYVQELGSGTPPTGGADEALNCTNFWEWQSLTIFPEDDATHEPLTYLMKLHYQTNVETTASGGEVLTCVGGTNHGTACTVEWNQGTPCTGTPAGVCMKTTAEVLVGTMLGSEKAEGLDSGFGLWGSLSYFRSRTHSSWTGSETTVNHEMTPGFCLQALGYLSGHTDLDIYNTYNSFLEISDFDLPGPSRVPCEYVTDSVVGAACLYYGNLTNRGSSGNVELELPPLVTGMDFLVTNQGASGAFWLDPNGTERFEAPATNADGDRLRSDSAGDALRVYVPEDGKARVIFNSGGWYDDD